MYCLLNSGFAVQENFGNVQRHLCLSQLRGECYWHLVSAGQMHRTALSPPWPLPLRII